MKIKARIVEHAQGSEEWAQHRAKSLNASDLAAAMGLSKYMTRSDLIARIATGFVPEADAATQQRFNAGHEAEAAARPLAEDILGESLYPVVLAAEVDGLHLSASLDGQDMGETTWEHKQANASLIASLDAGIIPEQYHPQMEQGLMLSGATRCLFMASNGTRESMRFAWYVSNPELRAKIIPTWRQVMLDAANYAPTKVAAKPVGRTPENLPALRIELTGQVTTSNLAQYKEHALAVFANINKDLKTDEDFATAEQTVKWCASLEDRLAAAKQHALSQTQSINQLFSTIDEISAEARRVRLDLDKLVKAQKESIRNEIMLTRTASLKAHIGGLNASIGTPLMPNISADFAGAMKGKRTVDTLRDAADTELARAKIEATNTATGIVENLATLALHSYHSALFQDVQALVLKQPDDLAATITARISTHEANLAAQKAEAEAKAAREAEVKAAAEAEQARKAAEWEEANEKARLSALENASEPPAKVVAASIEMFEREPEETGEMVRLGEINHRIAPLSITADGLAQLGFTHAATDKAAKLYLESQFPKICDALITAIGKAKYGQAVEA